MNGVAVNIVTVLLLAALGLMLLGTAVSWSKLAKTSGRIIPIQAFRSAAGLTAATFLMLGIVACWLAFTYIPWGTYGI